MFYIKSVTKISSNTVRVSVMIDLKEWNISKSTTGAYGVDCLLNVDIPNAVREQFGVDATNPTVDDSVLAVNGIKTLVIFYNDPGWTETPNNIIYVDFINKKRVA